VTGARGQLGSLTVTAGKEALAGYRTSSATRHTVKVGHWDGRHDNWQGGLRDTPWPSRS